MQARDIMTDKVVCARPTDSLFDAAELMLGAQVSALLVVSDTNEIVGIISEADLIRRAEIDTAPAKSWLLRLLEGKASADRELTSTRTRKIGDIMTKEVVTASEDTPLAELVERLQRHRVKSIPIVRDAIPVGIISRADLVRAVLSREPHCPAAGADDRSLREAVVASLDRQPWPIRSPLTVVVHDGAVDLWGLVDSEAVREACRSAAESVPGVREVKDHVRLAPALTRGGS